MTAVEAEEYVFVHIKENGESEVLDSTIDDVHRTYIVESPGTSLFARVIPSAFGPFKVAGGTEVQDYQMISCPGHAFLEENFGMVLERFLGPGRIPVGGRYAMVDPG